jgi:hypothetical protein
MSILNKLLGREHKEEHAGALSDQASALVAAAVGIIESRVTIAPGYTHVESPHAQLSNAVQKLREAHNLHPRNPVLHYAYASALYIAMEVSLAQAEMRELLGSNPDFILAKSALEGWERWVSPFAFPTLGAQGEKIHPVISSVLPKFDLLPIRDGLSPRAALFLRDSGGEFPNLGALGQAQIDVALVISSMVTSPQVVGIYARIWDNPRNPYGSEALGCPFVLRGDSRRSVFEFLCAQQDVDFVVFDGSGCILLNRRLAISGNMRSATRRLFGLLRSSPGRDVSDAEMVNATMAHKRKFSIRDVRF